MSDFISLGQTVIFQKEKVYKAIKLVPNKLIVFEKLRFFPEQAVGCKFGTLFQVLNSQLSKAKTTEDSNLLEDDLIKSAKDNRSLKDLHGESQSLKREDLIEMKEKGATGSDIIESLVKNSSSFSDKTAFSQKKYLKKKQKKYSSLIRILRPTGRTICKLYEEREPTKICNLRLHSASQILSFANVRSGSRVVVFETCSGVLLGMVLERLAATGAVVNLHIGESPANLFAVSHFPAPSWKLLHSLPLHKVAPLLARQPFDSTFGAHGEDKAPGERTDGIEDKLTEKIEDKVDASFNDKDKLKNSSPVGEKNENKSNSESKNEHNVEVLGENEDKVLGENEDKLSGKNEDKLSRENEDKKANGVNPLKRKQLSEEEKRRVREERRRRRREEQEEAWRLLGGRDMDALIVACRFHPTPIVLSLLETLGNSRPFAVYSEFKEPLMELFVRLSVSSVAVNLQLIDTFTREYQVLPERTHPKVQMNTGGGYLLTGIKVDNK